MLPCYCVQCERFFISVLIAKGEKIPFPYDCVRIAPVFSKVGLDFFGPLKVKHLRIQEKRYGCLLTCLVTRTVHLEVAFSLSTDSFIMCFKQFIARRCKPTVVDFDNGKSFVGANRKLRECINEWAQDTFGGVLSQEGIQWVFNPPAAPHMGGVWERLVRSCKKTPDDIKTKSDEIKSLLTKCC